MGGLAEKNLYDMNGDLYGYKVGTRGFVESISTNPLGKTLYHIIALCDGATMDGTEFYTVDSNRGGNYLREELKKGNLTWTEDDRYTANADGLQLEHWADNPWDGTFEGITTGDTCEDLFEGLDCEGLFYQLFDAQCGTNLPSIRLSIHNK